MSAPARLTREKPAPPAGIVHLGLGAFFRSHGALVVEDAVAAAGGDWGIIGASLRSPAIRNLLVPQKCAYTAVEKDKTGDHRRVVGIVKDVIFAPDDPVGLLDRMAHPDIQIVSLTVTEKGYCHIPNTGALNADLPDIKHDIGTPTPRSAIGFLVRALQKRRARGVRPFTVLSCDNLPNNGKIARRITTDLAQRVDPDLAAWIKREACFPSSMVDRIVPATTEADVVALTNETGVFDAAPVFHEPFLQWVIEDRFVDGMRPAFETVPGVEMVTDVRPFEHMKLRMLNGTHSALAYLGYLAGYETIAETMEPPHFREFVKNLWLREIIPVVGAPMLVDLQQYADTLLTRYENPSIRHRTWQIAMDGSQKLPQRILSTITDNRASGRVPKGLCLAVAAWMRYVGGQDEKNQPIDVQDPLAERLRKLSDIASTPREKAKALLTVHEVFGDDMDAEISGVLVDSFAALVEKGTVQSIIDLNSGG